MQLRDWIVHVDDYVDVHVIIIVNVNVNVNVNEIFHLTLSPAQMSALSKPSDI